MDEEAIASIVQNLVRELAGREDRFQRAAAAMENADIKTLFLHYSRQRAQFAAELSQFHAPSIPHEPEPAAPDSIVRDIPTLLSVCEHDEGQVLEKYRKALDLALPEDILRVIAAQGLEIKTAHDKIRSLRHLGPPT